jgi:hypothetical protein
MQKPLTVKREGNCQKALSRANCSNSTAKNQALPTKYDIFTNLVGKVRDKRLTESLEILNASGIEGEDLALFMIANLQQMEVAR